MNIKQTRNTQVKISILIKWQFKYVPMFDEGSNEGYCAKLFPYIYAIIIYPQSKSNVDLFLKLIKKSLKIPKG